MDEKLQQAQEEWQRLKKVQEERNYQPGWIYYRLRDQFDHSIADQVCKQNQGQPDSKTQSTQPQSNPAPRRSHRVCTCDPYDVIEDGCWCGADANPYREQQWGW